MSWVVADLPAPAPSDAELLRRYVKSRDEDAFARLVARHMRGVRMVAWRYTRHRQAAEDVAQAAFLILAQRPRPAARSARMKRSALPWLAKVTRYAAANWRRAEERRRRHESRAAWPASATAGDPSAGAELAEAVQSALSCLPRRDRRIVELRHLSQMPWDEVARHAGTSPEAARKAGTRALSQLRIVLEKRGITAGMAAVLAGLRALTTSTTTHAAVSTAGAASASELAKGVLMTLKLQTVSAVIASAVLVTGLALTAQSIAQDLSSRQATTRGGVASNGAPFRVELPDGGAIEVLYVAEHRSGGQAWAPDGSPLPSRPFELTAFHEGEGWIEYALRNVPPEDEAKGYITEGRPDGAVSRGALPPQSGGVARTLMESNAFVSLVQPQAGRAAIDLRLSVPAGEWQTVLKWLPNGRWPERDEAVYFEGFGIMGSEAFEHETDGTRYVSVVWATANAPVGKMQILREAVLKDGRVVEHNNSVSTRKGLAMSTSHFRDVTLEEVDHFRIRVRPLREVVVRNVAARPGVRTEPEADIGEPAEVVDPIDEPLGSPISFSDTPLERVLERFRTDFGVEVSIDRAAVEAARIDLAQPVNLSLAASLSKRKALELLLATHSPGLEMVVRNGTVFIGPAGAID